MDQVFEFLIDLCVKMLERERERERESDNQFGTLKWKFFVTCIVQYCMSLQYVLL